MQRASEIQKIVTESNRKIICVKIFTLNAVVSENKGAFSRYKCQKQNDYCSIAGGMNYATKKQMK